MSFHTHLGTLTAAGIGICPRAEATYSARQ
jgi:hypothetical protein